MNVSLLVKEIIKILDKKGFFLEAESLKNSEYGATGGEIFDTIVCNILKIKQNQEIYVLIEKDAEKILSYAKEIGHL